MKSKAYVAERMRTLFSQKGLDGLPVVLLTTQPNIFYFTQFTGHDSWALLTPEKTILITDGRYTLQARQESPQARIVIRKGPILQALADLAGDLNLKKIAFFGEEISVALLTRLRKACAGSKWAHVPSTLISRMRQIKGPEEIQDICRAITIAQVSFSGLLDSLNAGMTEQEVVAELEYRMRCGGAEKASFDIIVACGRNAAKPHARTSDTKLTAAKSIVFDFGALFKGYCSDLTRTVYLGKMPPYLKDMYQVCLESQLAAIEAVKPGIRAADVDKVARTIITRAGFGKFFNHGLGHGLGLEVHEAPTLSRLSDQILVPGMVVTVEPGIYLPGKGGVRIEDDVLVTPKGCRVLSSLPKEMEEVIF
jgi:Xaa-Pro aminopeptidase